MARSIATNDTVDREQLLEFIGPRHQMILITTRKDGSPQASPVSGGLDDDGRILIATYPERAKVKNVRRDARASVLVLSQDWNDAWVQVDGSAEVLDIDEPETVEEFVTYFRNIAGEHSDWDEYRQAMRDQGKSLIRLTPQRWGPVATGGFPARLA